ncbi:MAG: hypothetical protein JXB47_19080 [Anaerolineae bacterium]|nr:hypothetical protein [Anaerolineae bacterium]
MKELYRVARESPHRIYVEITGAIGLEFVRELWAALDESDVPICVLLRNTQDSIASLATVSLLYKSARDPRIKAVAAFDLTSAQTLLVEWLLLHEGIETFRVFVDEETARAYLDAICED